MYVGMYVFCIAGRDTNKFLEKEKAGQLDVKGLLSNHIPSLPTESYIIF